MATSATTTLSPVTKEQKKTDESGDNDFRLMKLFKHGTDLSEMKDTDLISCAERNGVTIRELMQIRRDDKAAKDEETRKNKAAANDERRKEERHRLEMNKIGQQNQQDMEDSHGKKHDAPISRAVKGLLICALGDAGSMSAACPMPGCASLVSPFSYAGIGEDLSSLMVCCNACAKNSNAKLCKTFSMKKTRALSYLQYLSIIGKNTVLGIGA